MKTRQGPARKPCFLFLFHFFFFIWDKVSSSPADLAHSTLWRGLNTWPSYLSFPRAGLRHHPWLLLKSCTLERLSLFFPHIHIQNSLHVFTHVHTPQCREVSVSSRRPPRGSNLGHLTWWQEPLPTKTFHLPCSYLYLKVFVSFLKQGHALSHLCLLSLWRTSVDLYAWPTYLFTLHLTKL